MMDKLKGVQLWIHRHYDDIKIFLIVLTLGLVLVGIYSQGVANEQRADENALAIEEIQKNTKSIDSFTKGVSGAVQDLKADNLDQTVILCTIILKGDVSLDDQDAIDVQRICEEEVQKAIDERRQLDENEANGTSQAPIQNNNTPNPIVVNPGPSNPGPQGPAGPQGPPATNPQQPAPGPIQGTVQTLDEIINGTLEGVTNAPCNVLGLLCR